MSWGHNDQGLSALVLAEVRAVDRPLSALEVVALTGLPRQRVYMILDYLCRRDRLQRMGREGAYHYTAHEPMALPAIDLQPVGFLTVSLGVRCDARRLAA